ncbi:proton-coupled folate transporter [Episyrphus balteatus]|uniref:proton-coupled folate transporter n=1 Tax=Episyrphus balteatus TaxID=286459 RepID=UPI00248677A9|nr:proton-coupled folate transporter [Episyrphus balteatus]XP_055844534.1 proton-coupled folate transporter [Episyrphus balteatus]
MDKEPEHIQESCFQRCKRNLLSPWYRDISVEPTMFLYMFAFLFTSVVEQDFFVRKSCLVNNNYSLEICTNLDKFPEIKKEVQITTSKFHQWENISAHIFPIVLALFLGSWSDRRGRKFPLLMGLCGKFIYSIMMVVNAKQKSWPVEYVIFTATLPCAITGADVAIFASCFAYISDVSTLRNRTMRVTILDICYLSAMPTGVAFGSYMFNSVLNKSYASMFAINASIMFVGIVYSIIFLKWQTTPKQRSLRELSCSGFFPDFFDFQHLQDSIGVLVKKRPGNRRSFLIILLISMALYTFQRDEKPYLYLYAQLKFQWDVQIYSTFKTFQSSAYVVAALIAIPLMNKILGWRDTTIIFIGVCAHISARFFYYFADTPSFFYTGAVVCCLGPIVGPMIRSITSKIVPQSERGKVFALLSVCDNAVPFVSGICYSQIYRATIGQRSAVFLLTIATQVVVFFLTLGIHLKVGNNELALPDGDKENGLIPESVKSAEVVEAQTNKDSNGRDSNNISS